MIMKAQFEFLSSSNAAAHEVQPTLDNILPYAGKQTVASPLTYTHGPSTLCRNGPSISTDYTMGRLLRDSGTNQSSLRLHCIP